MNLANFTLAKTSLIRLGCPVEVQGLLANRALRRPIIAVANKKEYGKTASDYCPSAVVVCGGEMRRQLLAQGYTKSWAWVENGAVEIAADDAIHYDEFMARLSSSLQDKYYQGLPGQARPGITQVHPFDNSLMFNMRGRSYQQNYAFDPVERTPRMMGDAINASEDPTTYNPASKAFMPQSQTGAHYVPGWTPGNSQSTTQGGHKSELVTMIIRDLSDVMRAVAQYLAVTKGARSIKPDFSPHAATYDKKINAMLQAKGVDAFEFALWVAAKERGELEQLEKKMKTKKKVAATVTQISYPRQGGTGSGSGYPTGQMAQAIKAGGPGSGRHPGVAVAHDESHQLLTRNGYALKQNRYGVAGQISDYQHTNGRIASVDTRGNWQVGSHSGKGSAALYSHLKKG